MLAMVYMPFGVGVIPRPTRLPDVKTAQEDRLAARATADPEELDATSMAADDVHALPVSRMLVAPLHVSHVPERERRDPIKEERKAPKGGKELWKKEGEKSHKKKGTMVKKLGRVGRGLKRK